MISELIYLPGPATHAGSTQEKLSFALKEFYLLLSCATVVIAATLAHVGLLFVKDVFAASLFIILHVYNMNWLCIAINVLNCSSKLFSV